VSEAREEGEGEFSLMRLEGACYHFVVRGNIMEYEVETFQYYMTRGCIVYKYYYKNKNKVTGFDTDT
jgi:hypothetical protein